MADTKISGLTAAGALDGSELVEAVQGGVNVQTTTQDIADLAAAGSGHVIEDDGTPLTQRTKLNFVGAGVTVTDDSGDDASVVTIPAASETVAGVAELATQAEVTTGTDDARIVTPLKLTTWAGLKMITLASDDTNNNGSANTMEDVGGLSFAVVNGGIYYFRFIIDFTTAAATTGCRWAVNGPTVTRLNYQSRHPTGAGTESVQVGITTYDGTTVSTSSTTSGVAQVEGFITPSADGTVVLRFASEVAGSAVVAKAGSILLYARLN